MTRQFFLLLSLSILVCASPSVGARAKPKLVAPAPAEIVGATFQVTPATVTGGQTHPEPLNIVPGAAVTYSQDFGGAGVAGGVLLGPLGVLANIKAIKNRTAKDVAALTGKLDIDPVKALQTALDRFETDAPVTAAAEVAAAGAEEGSQAAATAPAPARTVALTPYIYINRSSADELMFRVTVDASLGDWSGRYVVALAKRIPLAEASGGMGPERQAELRDAIVDGYLESLQLMQRDARGELATVTPRKMYVDVLSPRLHFVVLQNVVASTGGRTVLRSIDMGKPNPVYPFLGGLVSIPDTAITE